MAKSKKGKKINRNRVKCARYAAEHRRVKNGPKLERNAAGQVTKTPRTQRPRERTPH